MAKIINGKLIAENILGQVREQVEELFRKCGRFPKLSVILVGDDPASQIYVRNKENAARSVGILSETHGLPLSIKQDALISLINDLNSDAGTDGILVQLPLPPSLNEQAILEQIDPTKDVDGLHFLNLGKLVKDENPFFIPCTPQGIIELILSTGVDIVGKEAVVIGRSNIVGKPVGLLLLKNNATVTFCHSKSQSLAQIAKRADILVVAVGRVGIVTGDMIKEGAVVIDVGMNRVGNKVVGDVDFESASSKAGYITPVPGGVGPMTIAMLLKNTLKSAQSRMAK